MAAVILSCHPRVIATGAARGQRALCFGGMKRLLEKRSVIVNIIVIIIIVNHVTAVVTLPFLL